MIDTSKLLSKLGKLKLSLTRGFTRLACDRNVFFRIKDSLRNLQLRMGTMAELAENKKMY